MPRRSPSRTSLVHLRTATSATSFLPEGRYGAARGKVKSAYQGRYRVSGDHNQY